MPIVNDEKRIAIRKEFASNLKMLIAERGWDKMLMNELGYLFSIFCEEKIGTSVAVSVFRTWYKGEALPIYDNFLLLADWLDCEPNDLLPKNKQHAIIVRFLENRMGAKK